MGDQTAHRARLVAVAVAAAHVLLLLSPATGQAHFEIKPAQGDPGATRAFTFGIENERSDASTVRLDVQLPTGVELVGARSLGGWTLRQSNEQGLRQLIFRARRPLGPGEASQKFKLSLKMPVTPGATVSFKGVQTYDDGEKARWIGPPGSDQPAPTVRISTRNVTGKSITGATGTTGDGGVTGPGGGTGVTDAGGATGSEQTEDDDDGGMSGALIAILVAAGVAVIGGGAYMFTRARGRGS